MRVDAAWHWVLEEKELVMVGVLLVGVLLAVLNQTLLSPAGHHGRLAVDATTVQWLTSGYSLVEAVVIPLSAYLIGRFSTRPAVHLGFRAVHGGQLGGSCGAELLGCCSVACCRPPAPACPCPWCSR